MEERKNKSFLHKMAELSFALYMITLYLFVLSENTLVISQIAFILFAGCTGLYLLNRNRFHLGKPIVFAYLACGWMFATVLWAYSRYYAVGKVKTMWQIFILFFLVYNLYCADKDAHKKIIKILYISGIAFCGYTVYEYGVSGILKALNGGKMVRLGGSISQENVFGMQHATTTLIGIYYLLYNRKHKLFNLAIIASSFICAMSSGSKKALLIVVLGGLYLIYKKYGIKQLYKTVFVGVVGITIFMTVIQLPMFETINTRVERAIHTVKGETGGDGSTQNRLAFIEKGWDLFSENPLYGYGANNYRIVSGAHTYSHNNFIEILVNFGLVGFLLYYAMYTISYNRLRKNNSDSAKFMFVLFIVRMVMEVAMVTYYDKLTWILLAFFMIDSEKWITVTEGGADNGVISQKIEKGIH